MEQWIIADSPPSSLHASPARASLDLALLTLEPDTGSKVRLRRHWMASSTVHLRHGVSQFSGLSALPTCSPAASYDHPMSATACVDGLRKGALPTRLVRPSRMACACYNSVLHGMAVRSVGTTPPCAPVRHFLRETTNRPEMWNVNELVLLVVSTTTVVLLQVVGKWEVCALAMVTA